MRTCATCKFMAAERGHTLPHHHSCTRIIHGNGDGYSYRRLSKELACVVDGSGYAARLIVLPTFGCILHEEKAGLR